MTSWEGKIFDGEADEGDENTTKKKADKPSAKGKSKSAKCIEKSLKKQIKEK